MATATFEQKDPGSLKNHPLSIEIYGEELDEQFVESVKTAGILVPLRVLRDGTVVAGRRRRMVAMKLKQHDARFRKVPCIVVDGKADDLDIQAEVIHANRENERSMEQRAREYRELKRIEIEKAEARMKAAPIKAKAAKIAENNGKSAAREKFPTDAEKTGKASEIAAEVVGLSDKTAEKAVEVVEKIDELEERGHTHKAEELRETLNKNVAKAHRELESDTAAEKEVKDPAGNVIPKRIQKPFELVSRFRGLINKIGSITTEIEEMAKERGGEKIPLAAVRTAVKDLQATIKPAMPFAICPFCKGFKCTKCKDTGWLHEDAWNGIPKAKREEMLA